jgi:hypothetical protein
MSLIEKYDKMLDLFDPLVPDGLGYRIILAILMSTGSAMATLVFAFHRSIVSLLMMLMTMFTSYGVGKLLLAYDIEKSDYSFSKQVSQGEQE